MKSMLKNLQKEIAFFLVTLVISSTIIIVSIMYRESAIEEKQIAANELSEAKEKYYLAIDRKKLLIEFENKYKKLEKTGIVGDERRLSWIDTIEKTTQLKKIPYVRYKINKQIKSTQNELAGSFPGVDVFQSEMLLDMQLLHEGDLYTMINQLDEKAEGLFDIRNCIFSRVQRIQESILESKTDKNFTTKCKLIWYTIKPKLAPSLVSQMD